MRLWAGEIPAEKGTFKDSDDEVQEEHEKTVVSARYFLEPVPENVGREVPKAHLESSITATDDARSDIRYRTAHTHAVRTMPIKCMARWVFFSRLSAWIQFVRLNSLVNVRRIMDEMICF